MKHDALKQFAKLHRQLTEEKSRFEARLAEINAVLAPQDPSTALDPIAAEYLDQLMAPPRRRGRSRHKVSRRGVGARGGEIHAAGTPAATTRKRRKLSPEGRARIAAAARARWARARAAK